jgi:two-component system response regulator YesN
MYKLLIVDDESLTRLYMRQNISSLDEKWEVSGEASDGIEALEFLSRSKVDLVMTDIKMPVMDGLELCSIIHHDYPGQQVIILSGYDEFSYAQQAIRYDVDDYLLKPLIEEELLAALGKVSSRIENEKCREQTFSVKALENDPLTQGHTNEQNHTSEQNITDLARNFICSHYFEPISLVQIAEHIGVSSNYLSCIFHKQVGESYIKFLTRVRMEQAAKLLSQKPQVKISDISDKIGYVSVKHFLHVFKQYFNSTPGEYRSKGI